MADWQDPERVRFMLDDCETWAVVGLSGDPGRTAYSIAELLQQRGKRIVPVHPSAATVLGEQGYATLADIPFAVDVVDVFRRSEAAGEFADQAVAIGAKGVWFQLGVATSTALDEAQRARLVGRLGSPVRIVASEHRSQHRNRVAARERLVGMLREALAPPPPPRRPTKPTRGSQRRRLETKKQRGRTKALRGRVRDS